MGSGVGPQFPEMDRHPCRQSRQSRSELYFSSGFQLPEPHTSLASTAIGPGHVRDPGVENKAGFGARRRKGPDQDPGCLQGRGKAAGLVQDGSWGAGQTALGPLPSGPFPEDCPHLIPLASVLQSVRWERSQGPSREVASNVRTNRENAEGSAHCGRAPNRWWPRC